MIPSGTYYLDISVGQMRPGKKAGGYGWMNIPARESPGQIGDAACAVGQNHTLSTCGKVTAIGVTTSNWEYDRDSITNRAARRSYPGDSGGAMPNDSGVLSIVSSAPGNGCNDSYFPISMTLRASRNSIPSSRLY